MSKHEKCHLCDATCLQCTGPEREDCTSCPSTRFFNDGRCDIRCQSGHYAMERQCHLCHHTCKECNDEGPENCTSCDKDKFGDSRYLFKGQCLDVCPEGFFGSARKRCEPCDAECFICSAANLCLQCSPGYNLKNGLCIPLKCSAGEVSVEENENCLPCDEGCEQCKRDDSGDEEQKTVCLKCEHGYYQLGNNCHQSCPDQTYSVNDTMICAPCEDKHCANCDESQCYWCKEGFYVSEGECVDHCVEGFFVDEESQECEPCHRSCRACGGPRYDDCDSCEDGFTLKDGECLEGRLMTLCPEKHFRNTKDKCELCHSSCKTCIAEGRGDCSSCYPGNFLTAQQTCLSRCPSGTFANKTSGRCDDCLEGCVSCQDAKLCQRCRTGLYLQNGVCVVECQRGFPQGDACQLCSPECESCEEKPTRCLSCEERFLLLDHSCRSYCPEGYYATDTECHHCPDHCIKCNQDGLCEKCAHYHFLHNGTCVDDCPDGYFTNDKQDECVRCHVDCGSCDGPGFDDCIECRNKKAVRYNGECLPKCPKGTYYDETTNECRDCDRSCLTCSGHEPSSCLSCDTDRRKDASGHCVWYRQCSLQSYVDQNGECQQCHKLCHRCSGPGKDHCLSCNEPYFLMNNMCVQECPVGYYADKDVRVCERCHFTCQSCVGRHSVECLICKPGFFKQGINCVETCSESHFGNKTTMLCERCDPSCSKCWGHSNRNCLSCREGYVYLRQWGQCLQRCPLGYYQDSQSKTCQKCHPTCKSCTDKGALSCESCYDGFTLMSGICNSPCFVGYYAALQDPRLKNNEPNCKACDPSCLSCRGPSMWNCTECHTLPFVSDDGRCLTCCGNESRHNDKPIPRECCNCESSIVECIMGVNYVMREGNEAQGSTAEVFVTSCVVLILIVGVGSFIFLSARSKTAAVAHKTRAGGYEKLDTNGSVASQPATSSFGEYSDRIIECEDDDEEDEDDDIVYMAQDGTVYRKFKYGLLDEDEIELEYDDESYSYS